MFRLGLYQRGRIDHEHVVFDGLAKNEGKGVPIPIPRCLRPIALFALLQEPCLDVLARDSFRG